MAASPSRIEVKAELLIRLPGSEDLHPVGTISIPVNLEYVGPDQIVATADTSGFERMAKAYEEK